MNVIKVKVNFSQRTSVKQGVDLTEGDYNSTKMVFDFDTDEGTKIFQMKNPSDEIVLEKEIINNEVILTGKADVTTTHNEKTYVKYLDDSSNVYWYNSEDEELYDSTWTLDTTTSLDTLTKQTEDASIFTETGSYVYEISLYDGDSKLTSASDKIKVKKKQIGDDSETAVIYKPVFDELLGEVAEALEEIDNIDIDASKSGNTATMSITNKEGTTKTVEITDGQNGLPGPANVLTIGSVTKGNDASASITGESPNQVLNLVLPKGDKGDKGDKGNTGATGNDGFSPSASVTQLSGGATITITDKTGTTTATITSGEQGPTGPAGKDGKDGKDGTNGTNATINGVSTLTLTAGTNISLEQQGSTLTINSTGGGGGTSDYTDLTNKPSINNITLSGNKTTSDLGLGTYSKPSGGIPKTDLASAVQTSLGKADTAIQSSDLTNYVTNTDYATSSTGGVIKVSNGDYGMTVDSGVLKGTVRTLAQYNDMSSKGIVCKGTLENVLDDRIGDVETILTRLTTGGGVS